MSGHRQAAVALHALGEPDRALLLAELPERDQRILRGYLDELDELGFDTVTAADVADAMPRGEPAVKGDLLERARPAEVHALLQGEPATLIAQLLSVRPWTWRSGYLAMQTNARREQLRAAAPDGAVAPARAEFLVAALHARLAQLPAPAPTAPERSVPTAWRRLVRLPWTR